MFNLHLIKLLELSIVSKIFKCSDTLKLFIERTKFYTWNISEVTQ